MSQFSFSKQTCLDRAKSLAANDDLGSLLYAALEARLCMEAIAYDKLKLYAPRLPEAVLKKWQPPQLFKALLEYEPDATQNFTLFIGEEPACGGASPMRPLGTHVSFKPSELQKFYNKLGSFLHSPMLAERNDAFLVEKRTQDLKNFLSSLLPRLEQVAMSTLDASLALVVDFECKKCHQVVFRNLEGLKTNPKAVCLNPQCQAIYHADLTSNPPNFVLEETSFKCPACEELINLEDSKLNIGTEFTCPKCKVGYEIVKHQWIFGRRGATDEA